MPPRPIDINFVSLDAWWNPKRSRWGRYVWLSGKFVFYAAICGTVSVAIRLFYVSAVTSQNTEQIEMSVDRMKNIEKQLSIFNTELEIPRWKLAEKLLQEKTMPWSRLLYELEVSLPDGVRLSYIQKTRGIDQQIVLKLEAESETQEAKLEFIRRLGSSLIFKELILESENQSPEGSWVFEMTLPVKNIIPRKSQSVGAKDTP